MFGKVGEIVVFDVLGHELPGGMAVLFDSFGTKRGGCNVFVQVQADRRLVCGGLRMDQITPSIAIRVCADGVCAVNTRRCWLGLVVANGAELSREWQ